MDPDSNLARAMSKLTNSEAPTLDRVLQNAVACARSVTVAFFAKKNPRFS